jgi:hypothetical protein
MLSVVGQSVNLMNAIVLSVIMLSVFVLTIVVLDIILPSVVALYHNDDSFLYIF